MARERTLLLVGAGIAILIVAALLLTPRIAEKLAPKPQRAWVAIQPAGERLARTGRVEMPAGTTFNLHAVLQATGSDGETVYYTQARELEIDGRRVPAEALRAWDRPQEVRILWFTVEGEKPFLPVESAADLEKVTFAELFRADWPQTWSVPGVLEPRHDDHLRRVLEQKNRPFGTQRFHVRIELLAPEGGMVPVERYKSAGAAELGEDPDALSTVVATLPGPAGPASRVFGLTQVVPPENPSRELLAAVDDLASRELAFSVATMQREMLAAAGLDGGSLAWKELDLARDDLRWEADVRQGDLLRSGPLVAVLYRDGGRPGALDGGDLVLTYDHGAAVLPLSEVFLTLLPVEWASLAPR